MRGDPILIVDDTPVNLKLTRILLEHEGYEVRTASSAEEALELLESFRPRLVLADIQMPGVDGLEMTRRIKRDPRNRGMLVVALTALAMDGDQARAMEAGCDGYITKPINTRALTDQVRGYLQDGAGLAAGAPPLATDDLDELRVRFLEEARQQVPLWIEELDGAFNAVRAQQIAHQWVGAGGLLGFRQTSILARQVETMLREKPLDGAEVRDLLETLLAELLEPTLAEDQPASRPVAALRSGGALILIADGDPTIRAIDKAMFASEGIECRTVTDGRAALDAIRELRPAAVVLDGNMPGMNEVLAELRAGGAQVKVLMLEADEDPQTSGADDVLLKPFNPVELVVRVKKLL
jgi:two-component system cell cycle response regulator DivK